VAATSEGSVRRDSAAPDTLAILATALEIEAANAQESLRQLASTNPTNWRRALLQEPKRTCKTIPLRETYAASHVPTEMRTNAVAIASESSSTPLDTRGGAHVHPSPREQYKPTTPERATTLKLLRSIDEPLTKVRVARALCWTEDRAREWLAFFASKGVLVVRGGRHYWATRRDSR
jgi:hypothetical protein